MLKDCVGDFGIQVYKKSMSQYGFCKIIELLFEKLLTKWGFCGIMCAVKIRETNLLGLRPIRASLSLRYITFHKNAPSSKHFYSCYNMLRKDLRDKSFGTAPHPS